MIAKEKSKLLVGRKWHNPEIYIKVCPEGINIEMELADAIRAACQEFGNPTTVVTVKGLEKRMLKAVEKVIAGMKKESERIV